MPRFFKRRSSFLPTFFSISLVLFLAGWLGLFVLNAHKWKVAIKEDLALEIYFRDEAPVQDIMKIRDNLAKQNYVKSAEYIDKEKGARIWPMGAEGIKLLGFNPIPNSVEVHFRSGFVAVDSLNMVKTALEKNPGVREVQYDTDVVSNLDRTMRLAELLILGLSILIAALSIGLINNAIRLNMYARRFLIKSMQMVGATRNFIRKPFILAGVTIGFCGALFAACLLTGSVLLIPEKFRVLFAINNYLEPAALLFSLIIMGVLITGLSSYFAINKYLKLKLDDLF